MRSDVNFDYLYQLEQFQQRIKQDIDYISLLFPEYTPHDKEYHLRPLFHLAGQLLGVGVIRELNATELFLFSFIIEQLERLCINRMNLYFRDCYGIPLSDRIVRLSVARGISHNM